MATAVLRQGDYVDQYKIDDPGGPYDNNLIYIAHRVNEVVVQVSSVNYHTSQEALLCWTDNSIPECPDDLVGSPLDYRMPVVKFLDDIMAAGGVSIGADLTELAEKGIYLAFWFEYRTQKVWRDALAEMIAEGMNALQQRRSLKYVIYGNGVPLATAQAVANNWITNSVQPTYKDLSLATIPRQDRRLLKLFGAVGWQWFAETGSPVEPT